jgi:transcriptional regulator with XRE-family HTH domain
MAGEPTLPQFVGRRIRELRDQYDHGTGISQEALAKKLDTTANTVSRWETATYKPTLEDLEALARFFGVSVLHFFPGEEPSVDERVKALLRAAQTLPANEIEELRRYAEYRRARHLYRGGGRPSPGRRPKKKAS